MPHKKNIAYKKPAGSTASRVRKHRQKMKAAGFKEIRLWVPDVDAPGFDEECRRQVTALQSHPEESEVLDFIEQAADWGDEA